MFRNWSRVTNDLGTPTWEHGCGKNGDGDGMEPGQESLEVEGPTVYNKKGYPLMFRKGSCDAPTKDDLFLVLSLHG